MLSEIFVRPASITRLQAGPLGPYVEGFASEMKLEGYSFEVIRRRIRIVNRLSLWLKRRRLQASALCEARLDEFLRPRERKRASVPGTVMSLLEHLRRSGVVCRPRPARSLIPSELVERRFSAYLAKERLLAGSTRVVYLGRVRRFLADQYGKGPTRFARLTTSEITGFVLRYARDHSRCPASAKPMTTALRSFLRFLRHEGEIDRDLAGCVPTVPSWTQTGLPETLRPREVRRILATCDQRTHVGRRNRAILLLLSRLGLRACEIRALSCDDIDWSVGEITVRGKGGRQDRLPMPSDVGAALAAYARLDRHPCKSREFFVMARAPYQRLASSESIGQVVRRAVRRAGLQPRRTGAHLLRHTAATQMLRRGASLAQIGEVLRHRRADTTAIYAKVDLIKLRLLAVRWPEVTL